MANGAQHDKSLEFVLKQRIDRICGRFEAQWKASERPQIESYIARARGRARTELLGELLAIELQYRARLGEHPSTEEYDACFPADVAVIREAFENASAGKPTAHSETAVEKGDGKGTLDGRVAAGALSGQSSDGSSKSPPAGSSANKSFGRFRILKLLGRGAFGSVYQAHDPQLDRDVALKIPHAGTIGTPADAKRFFREARAAGQLRHPYIVPVFDAGEVGNTYYIASAYVAGVSLRAAIQAGRFDAARAAAELLAKLAEALDYAHQQGIVHRDVKPDNILIDAAGNPYVLDFGMARRDEAQVLATVDGTVMGTPLYMSPEQARGKSNLADGRSDQWSLGVIFYELLCHARPFTGAGHELYTAILEHQPTAPRKKDPAIPRDLETITLKCLAKEPAQRYPSCADLGADLQRWLVDEPIRARRSGLGERAWRWSKKNPALAAAATVIGLLAVISTLSAIGLQRSRAESEAHANRALAALDKLNAEEEHRQRLEAALRVREAEIAEKEAKLKAADQLVRERERDLEDRNSKLSESASMLKQRDDSLATVTADLNSAKAVAGSAKAEAAAAEQRLLQAAEVDPFKLYQERLRLAITENSAGQTELALAMLNTCPAEFRGWEWEYLAKLAAGESANWEHVDHPKINVAVPSADYLPIAFDPQGRRLVSGRIRTVWDGRANTVERGLVAFDESGAEAASVAAPNILFTPPAFNELGDLMAVLTGGKNNVVILASTDRNLHSHWAGGVHPLPPLKDSVIQAVCLSPDGKTLACLSQSLGQRSAGIQHLTIHDELSDRSHLRGQKDYDVAYDRSDVIPNRMRKLAKGFELAAHDSLTFGPGGEHLLIQGGGSSRCILVRCDVYDDPAFWMNIATPLKKKAIHLAAGGLNNHAFSLMINSEGAITELPTGRVIRGPDGSIGDPVGFSPDDARLLCVSADQSKVTVYDTTQAAQGILRPVITMSAAEFVGLSARRDTESLKFAFHLALPSPAPSQLPAADVVSMLISTRLNAFALSWTDKSEKTHLRVWGL